jgi:hypothetical protein
MVSIAFVQGWQMLCLWIGFEEWRHVSLACPVLAAMRVFHLGVYGGGLMAALFLFVESSVTLA